ncbi:Uncharacterized protein PHSC3_000667 [Chlamydiales bacterium STE3]|nr:Uncharacterized protein PHSC3_000667 [Chlamydiales bacterium STE3]
MGYFILEKRKADALANGIFLVGLGILFYTGFWWPGILLVLFANLAIRQYFTHRIFDLMVTSVILLGLFLLSFFSLSWDVLMPVLFIFGGLYIILKEYFYAERKQKIEVIRPKDQEDGDV